MSRAMKPDAFDAFKEAYADLGGWKKPNQLPIVYHQSYNISFWGLEKIHPFDPQKFRKVVRMLADSGLAKAEQLVTPVEATQQQLLDVHSEQYLADLHGSSQKVAQVVELAPLAWLPNSTVQHRVTRPFRHHVGGTMLAAGLALEQGWAINIGGGMHHASFDDGSGWCAYSDLILALRRVRRASGGTVRKCMIVDLDVHQGNGHERDKLHFADDDLYIVDIYGGQLWPGDTKAKTAINVDVPIPIGTGTEEYLAKVASALDQAFSEFKPDLMLYNAGTDILEGDPLGRMQVSAEGIQQRDEAVFRRAAQHGVPICMVLSGGYARRNFDVVGKSIINLLRTFNLVAADGTAAPLSEPQPGSRS